MKFLLALAFLLLPCHSYFQDPKPAEEKPAAEKPGAEKPAADAKPAAKLVNPVKPTPASIASGKKSYTYDCAMCHGNAGGGDGSLATDMHLRLRDYRDAAALKELSDGDIYSIIANGKGQMTGEDGRMKPQQIWDVVNYVRSLAKK